MRRRTRRRDPVSAPAPSYAVHRERLLAATLPSAAAIVFGLTLFYAVVDQLRATPEDRFGRLATYGLELSVPLVALFMRRRFLKRHAEPAALALDLTYTVVLACRLFLPTTTESGTALILSLKILATALFFAWHPRLQVVSTGISVLLYYAAIVLSGRTLDHTHQMIGPLVAGTLACVGAVLADRTRHTLWQRTVELAFSEHRMRALFESERSLAEIAREISGLTDLPTLLDRINRLTAATLRCDFSTTYLLDERRREMAGAATSTTDPARRAFVLSQRAPVDDPLPRELLEGRTVVINDIDQQSWIDREDLRRFEVRRLVLTPIAAKGTTLGVLTAGRTTSADEFDRRQVSLLKAIAAQAAIAIENARLFEGLTTSEASYRDLFEHATDLIFVAQEDGAFRFANQAALDFLGIDEARLGALRWQDVLTPEARAQLARRMAIAARRRLDPERAFEIEARPPDGAPATLEIRTRLVSRPGQASLYQCIARDVTERRRHEIETQQLLRQLRESNRLQTEFVANMSHELRTPLNVIIGYADLLADEPSLPRGSDGHLFLQRIAAAGRALHRLVESVLEYARFDRGRQMVITSRFPADRLLLELRALCHDIAGGADLTVCVQDRSDIEFFSDYDRLYSVLSNLLLNALKFTPEGIIELCVERLGDDAQFTVRDTGIGMDEEALAHVFEPFRQVDGSPTRSYGGVGLGLAIVRRNAALLGGAVAVDSALGVGSTFRVRIPIYLDAETEPARASSAA